MFFLTGAAPQGVFIGSVQRHPPFFVQAEVACCSFAIFRGLRLKSMLDHRATKRHGKSDSGAGTMTIRFAAQTSIHLGQNGLAYLEAEAKCIVVTK